MITLSEVISVGVVAVAAAVMASPYRCPRTPLAAVGRRRWPRLLSTSERSTRSKGGPGAHDHRGLRLLRGRRRDGQVDAGARPRGVARAARLPPAPDLRAGRHP